MNSRENVLWLWFANLSSYLVLAVQDDVDDVAFFVAPHSARLKSLVPKKASFGHCKVSLRLVKLSKAIQFIFEPSCFVFFILFTSTTRRHTEQQNFGSAAGARDLSLRSARGFNENYRTEVRRKENSKKAKHKRLFCTPSISGWNFMFCYPTTVWAPACLCGSNEGEVTGRKPLIFCSINVGPARIHRHNFSLSFSRNYLSRFSFFNSTLSHFFTPKLHAFTHQSSIVKSGFMGAQFGWKGGRWLSV